MLSCPALLLRLLAQVAFMVNPVANATAQKGATKRVSPRPIEPEQAEQLDDLLGVQELAGRSFQNAPDRGVWVGRPLASEADVEIRLLSLLRISARPPECQKLRQVLERIQCLSRRRLLPGKSARALEQHPH